MTAATATAIAKSNIAFIKYWGNRNHELRLPSNGSISMNLEGLHARTTVTLDALLAKDELFINQREIGGNGLARVSRMLELVRVQSREKRFMRVESENNFPAGAGIASSAAAFAALALAASAAAGLNLNERELSILARSGSGSAARSIPAGFVEWLPGERSEDSFAFSIAPPEHWNLTDCVAIVSAAHKKVGSTEGHALADSSPLQAARVADAPRRLEICRRAILQKDFEAFAEVIEHDSDMMHAVMMTSRPPLMYWQPATVGIFHAVRAWRQQSIPAAYTVDAGANVHVLCLSEYAAQVEAKLRELPGVSDVLTARAGGAAHLVE